jgi:hypothetical protein
MLFRAVKQTSDESHAHTLDSRRLERRPRIREATFNDYSKIAALEIRNGLTTRPFEDWMDVWRSNPAYQQWKGEWPIGWVL